MSDYIDCTEIISGSLSIHIDAVNKWRAGRDDGGI